MKNINITVIGMFILGLIFVYTPIAAQTIEKTSNETALPTLRGDEAIDKLKETGQYDSLMEAVKASSKKDGQTEEPNTEDAIGQSARLFASDGEAGDNFGISLSISGDTAIVGAFLGNVGANADQGSAYIFVRSGTAWTQQAKLTASDGAAGDLFGRSVSISGDTAIVGAYLDDVGANADQGSAYVFVRSGTTWAEQSKLTASDGAADDQFGINVSISGDTAIVGTSKDDVGANADQGSAYIFVRSGTTWTEQSKLTASDGAAIDGFGFSVAITGDTAIVGTSTDDVGANVNQGSAYVFVRSGTTWTEQAKLTASDGAANDIFGFSVSISGDTAIVGALSDDVGANPNQGSAYVFVRSGTTWTEQAKLTASDGAANDGFGVGVSISGDTAIVGASSDDVGANTGQGSAYVFVRSGTTWTQQAKLTASDGAANDLFGVSVAISGNDMIVGAYIDNIFANTDQGSAYMFRNLSGIWTQESRKAAADGAIGDQFGWSVAISGDTAIVGSQQDDVTAANQGSAYIFVRSGTSWIQQAKLTASDAAADDRFGWSVAIEGDTVIVGTPQDDATAADQGSAYVFVRSGTTWTQQTKLVASDAAANDFFGFSVAISGETVIVGAFLDDVTTNDQGSAYVFVRSGTAWTQQAKLVASDPAASDNLGGSVAISGDTAIVGAYLDDVTFADQGSAYVFVRSGTTWTQQAKLTASDAAGRDLFGRSVSIDGDTVIVGAYLDDDAGTDSGSAYVFVRSGTTWTQQTKLVASDASAGDIFGFSVAIDGDTVIVGAVLDDVTISDQGSAYVFVRSGTTWTQQAKLVASDPAANDQFGYSVAISGDKIVVGAPLSDVGAPAPLTKGQLAPQAADQGGAYFFINGFATTAANVSVAGRVLTNEGAGLRNAIVYLTDSQGNTRKMQTGSFGNFMFDGIEAGETVVITVVSKGYSFTPRTLQVNDNVTDLDFTALP